VREAFESIPAEIFDLMKIVKKSFKRNEIYPARLGRDGTSIGDSLAVEQSYDIHKNCPEKLPNKYIYHNPEVRAHAHFIYILLDVLNFSSIRRV
jgi:hypothetical protein